MIDDREARLTEWRRRGREKGREFAAETKRGMAAGGTAETWARALAESTVELTGEFSAGATRDEVTAYVNELLVSFGETIATGDRRAKGNVDPRRKSPRSRSRRRRGESPEPRSSMTTT